MACIHLESQLGFVCHLGWEEALMADLEGSLQGFAEQESNTEISL